MTATAPPELIDRSRPFLPERLTPLAHTAAYRDLDADQRRRYNQLHAVYINEQILFFETVLAPPILGAALRDRPPAPLADSLVAFLADEAAHARMFRAFNRRCAPELYDRGHFHFVRIAPAAAAVIRAAARHPRALPLFLWLMLVMEERAVHHAREILRERTELAPAFVALHRKHLVDEVRHVQWDQALLDWLWTAASPRRRRINGLLFRWLLGEFFNVPKRAGLRVIARLVDEFPALASRLPELTRQTRALAGDPDYHRSLYSRRIVPRSFARFDAAPELHGLSHVLLGYEPAALR
jgi:para-aminobenzoate N-oxygenase AurF